MAVILASGSPRRRQLLDQVGIPFTAVLSPARESEGGPPGTMVRENALSKARGVARDAGDAIVIGADTTVVVGDVVLGKPRDAAHAVEMLESLAGRWHVVMTGVAVVRSRDGEALAAVESTRVLMREFSPGEARRYVETGEPLDKAGAYGIQGRGALLVTGIEGCYFNVVGLPLARLGVMLRDLGYTVPWGGSQA